MTFDLETIEKNLRQAQEALESAKADVAYWENFRGILSDPRAALATKSTVVRDIREGAITTRSYGELKNNVFHALPRFDEAPLGTKEIAEVMYSVGFKFQAAKPIVAVNEALKALNKEGKAIIAARNGVAHLWKKSEASSTDMINDMATMARETVEHVSEIDFDKW